MKKLLLSIAFLLPAMGMMAQTQVKTAEGILEGKDLSGITVFKGIPFAAPPVGNLRWKAPQPAQKWQGVREAKEFGPNPMQEPIFGDMNFGMKTNSEDCLYLNIWTPAKTMKEHLPVLIYFNGGGLMAGSGSEPRYAGDAMARKGIISITANYREGIFGFFAHPQLSKETSYKGSGNYGLTAKDGSYSKAEFIGLQKLAEQYGVNIIPEIDVPAHSLAFTHYKPEIGSKEYGMDHLDLFNPETYKFVDGLFKEYLEGKNPVFRGKIGRAHV